MREILWDFWGANKSIVSEVGSIRIQFTLTNGERDITINWKKLTVNEIDQHTDSNWNFTWTEWSDTVLITKEWNIEEISFKISGVTRGSIRISGITAAPSPSKRATSDVHSAAIKVLSEGGEETHKTNCPNCWGLLKGGKCPYCWTEGYNKEYGSSLQEKLKRLTEAWFNIVKWQKDVSMSSSDHKNTIFVDCEIDSSFSTEIWWIIGWTLKNSSSSKIWFISDCEVWKIFSTEIWYLSWWSVGNSSSSKIGTVRGILVKWFSTDTDSDKMKEKFNDVVRVWKELGES